MLVMKFKGAVLQNQETLAEIKNRIKEQNCCSIVVVSALKGVMPRLRQLYGLSLRRGAGFENEFNELKQVHEQLAYELLAGRKLEEYKVELQKELNDLYGILHHVGVLRESSHCMKDISWLREIFWLLCCSANCSIRRNGTIHVILC